MEVIVVIFIGAVFLFVLSVFIGMFFMVISSIFSVKVRQGEVAALYHEGSRRCKDVYEKPGRYWHGISSQNRSLRLRVDEPFIIISRPVEARTHDGMSAVLTVRLTMDVTNSARYVIAVVGKEVEEWREEILPILITQVVSGYTMTQTLNNREQVAQSIESDVAAWFAGNRSSGFGLSFKRAAIIDAASPRH